MGQYLQFRWWLRESSGSEKGLVATAAVVVVGLTGWALVPFPTGGAAALGTETVASAEGSTTGGLAPGNPSTGKSNQPGATSQAPSLVPGAVSPGGGSTGSSTGGSAVSAGGTAGLSTGGTKVPAGVASSKCGPPGRTDTGVTATQIRIAAVRLDLAGAIGNSAVGVASPEQQQQMAQVMADEINSRGGIACRKLVVTFFKANPIDPATAQRACLDIAQGNFYAAIDMGGFSYPPGANDCVAQRKVPIMASVAPTPSEAKQYSPYLMSLNADPIRTQRNAVFGMKAWGWFTAAKGFKKLGIFMDTCSPEVNNATFDALAKIGIPKSQISVASVACPTSGFASPAEVQSAVIQHVRDGVTNVLPVIGGGSFKGYTTAAQNQGFRPKYTTTNYDGMEQSASTSTGPDPDNFDGTVSATTSRIGQNTSGLTDPATTACMRIFKRHGLPEDWVMSPDASKQYLGGGYCSMFLTFAAAASKAPGLKRAGLAVGLSQLGRVALAFSFSDAVFNRAGKVTGGDFWWVIQWHKSCTCWKVIDRTLRPSFA